MLPEQFTERMKKMLGEEYDAFLDSFGQQKYQALRLNSLKQRGDGTSAADYLAPDGERVAVRGEAAKWNCHLTRVPWAECGYYYDSTDTPGKHPYHEAGLYYIQEPSAMAPVGLLDVRPGQRILDLCAAPGGKSTQIAALMQGEGLLVTNEIHPARAKILSENVERMGIRNACVTNETPKHLAEVFVAYFDRILVDAPCSGEGMFRKNEDACGEWSPQNVELCGDRQDEILECAASMLRPGGRLVYSTCTFAPKENEGSISRFLQRHKEFVLLPIDKEPFGGEHCDGVAEYVEDAAQEIRQTLRLWPHHLKGEGHYAALLEKRRNENVEEAQDTVPTEVLAVGGLEPGIDFYKLQKQKEMWDFMIFCQESLQMDRLLQEDTGSRISFTGHVKFLRFGDNLYLAPACMPALKGLKVLRPGLHVGTLKKNRFEPSHALALALTTAEVKRSFALQDATAYLSGQTLAAEGEKGWYLVCVDGFSIGWGKLAGQIMKNHYPKGLRK